MSNVIGYAVGAFDLFHVGHLNLLRQARSRCDFLIVGVATDELLVERKGRSPIIPFSERLEIVQNIGYVDSAVEECSSNRLDAWKANPFDVYFKGDDWKGTPKGAAIEREFSTVGVKVIYFPYTVHTSSTILRTTLDKINSGTADYRVAR